MEEEEITGYTQPTSEDLEAIRVVELKLKELDTLVVHYGKCELLRPHIYIKSLELGALIKESIKKQTILCNPYAD